MYALCARNDVDNKKQNTQKLVASTGNRTLDLGRMRMVSEDRPWCPTRHNTTDSVPTSNLVCIKEVAIRTTFCIARISYYTCNLVTYIQCTRYKNAFNKRF